jgi:hypothetical protein
MHSAVIGEERQKADGIAQHLLDTTLLTLLWAYVAVAAIASLAWPLQEFDESIPLVHGVLVQQGRIPNLDFPSFYPPLGLYLNAGMFSLLGRTVIASRAIGVILYVLVVFLTYRFFRSRFLHSRSVVLAAVLLVAASIGSALNLAVWPGFALSLVALLTYFYSHFQVRNVRWLIGISGILTGLALLYRVNFGAYVAAVIVGDLLLASYCNGRRLRSTALDLSAYLGPLMVCGVGFCLLIYGNNIAAGVYQFTVNTQKIMILRGFVNLEYDTELACAILLPLAWFAFRMVLGKEGLSAKALIPLAFAFVLLGVALAGRTYPGIGMILVAMQIASVLFVHLFVYRLERSELSIVLFFCCLVHYYLSRADWQHWRVLPIMCSMLLAFLMLSRSEKKEESSVSKGTSLAVLLSAFCLFLSTAGFRPVGGHVLNGAKMIANLALHPHLSDTDRTAGPAPLGGGWASVYFDGDELKALRYVRTITSRTDPIFVGVKDHSRAFINDLRFYWLAGRPIGSRVFQLEPRVASEAPVQRDIISDLERNDVKCLIIDHESYPGDETFLKSGYVGSTLLDEYILSHFREEARFGRFAILTRGKG